MPGVKRTLMGALRIRGHSGMDTGFKEGGHPKVISGAEKFAKQITLTFS